MAASKNEILAAMGREAAAQDGIPLRRNAVRASIGISLSVTRNPNRQKMTAEKLAALRSWLLDWELSWQTRRSSHDGDQLQL